MEKIIVSHVDKSYTSQSTDLIIDHKKRPPITRKVLTDLNVEFPVDEITVMVGRSGCGKSTLLRLLNGDDAVDSGEISMPELKRTIMLKPDPYVITWTSVLQNVAMAAGAGRTPEERQELAKRLVEMVQLDAYSDLTPMELSTGMKQRLGLARCLASKAEILLMDEPFASLDFLTREELQDVLLKVYKELPRTIILVTHQLDEALLLGHQVMVMHGDSTITNFDLHDYSYPRDLLSPEMQALKEAITEACREDAKML